jgi:hypothetical protein
MIKMCITAICQVLEEIKKKTNITNLPDYNNTYLFVDQGVRLWLRLLILRRKGNLMALWQKGVKSEDQVSMTSKKFLHSFNDTISINSTNAPKG